MEPWRGHLTPTAEPGVTVRVDRLTWSTVLQEVMDFDTRERAGALFVRGYPAAEPAVLVGIEWMPVPDTYVRPAPHGLAFDARFNLRVAERAAQLQAGAVLVHAHPGAALPMPSTTDAENGAAFLAFMRRRDPERAHGLLVVADTTITGIVETPQSTRRVERVVAAGIPTSWWTRTLSPSGPSGDDRQLLAIGDNAQERLSNTAIAVVGNSGGGSHVTQQLIHAGVGTLIVIDPDVIEETNLRRVVGATLADVNVTLKPELAVRTAAQVRPTVDVVPLTEAFPSTATITALRHADVIIGCVDGWDTRDDLNTFALQHRIPYIDIGIAVAGSVGNLGMRVGGQIAVVTPDGPCLRCMELVTDARVDASRMRRQGYADAEPEPQVVSLNGTVASEAVTAALMLLAGDHRLTPRRRYAYPPGRLSEVSATRLPTCAACQAAALPPVADIRSAEALSNGGSARTRLARRTRFQDWIHKAMGIVSRSNKRR